VCVCRLQLEFYKICYILTVRAIANDIRQCFRMINYNILFRYNEQEIVHFLHIKNTVTYNHHTVSEKSP